VQHDAEIELGAGVAGGGDNQQLFQGGGAPGLA
jgi:hypothetical protein